MKAKAGQPLEILGLFVTIAFGVLLWLFFDDVFGALGSASETYTTGSAAATGHQYLTQATEATLFVFVGIAVIGLLTIAVYQRV